MKKLLFLLLPTVLLISCNKFLDTKPDKKLVIPTTLQDAQALMDNYTIFNCNYPATGDQSDDNFFLDDTRYLSFSQDTRTKYVWSADVINDFDWSEMYQLVLNATIALETVQKIPRDSSNGLLWNTVKGEALFYRSYALFQVAQYYGAVYDSSTAGSLPGVPLRSSSDASFTSSRGNLTQTWDHIIQNFQEAVTLLPENASIPSRPAKAAAWGGLARTYLAMSRFSEAATAATACLNLHSTLLNFNTLDPGAPDPFSHYNAEVIFPSICAIAQPLDAAVYSLDTMLISSYSPNDLRGLLYFNSNSYGAGFRGSYDGDNTRGFFNGLAVDEMFLIRAECLARLGNVSGAMGDLNTLLKTRWKQGTFVPFVATDPLDALHQILKERRKELILRGTRWMDLRRLGKEPGVAVTPVRFISGAPYTLSPNSPRYTFLLPKQVINLTGMPQNPR